MNRQKINSAVIYLLDVIEKTGNFEYYYIKMIIIF